MSRAQTPRPEVPSWFLQLSTLCLLLSPLGFQGAARVAAFGDGAGSCQGPSKRHHPKQPYLPPPFDGGFKLEVDPGSSGQPLAAGEELRLVLRASKVGYQGFLVTAFNGTFLPPEQGVWSDAYQLATNFDKFECPEVGEDLKNGPYKSSWVTHTSSQTKHSVTMRFKVRNSSLMGRLIPCPSILSHRRLSHRLQKTSQMGSVSNTTPWKQAMPGWDPFRCSLDQLDSWRKSFPQAMKNRPAWTTVRMAALTMVQMRKMGTTMIMAQNCKAARNHPMHPTCVRPMYGPVPHQISWDLSPSEWRHPRVSSLVSSNQPREWLLFCLSRWLRRGLSCTGAWRVMEQQLTAL